MSTTAVTALVLDLAGTFAFALNGALTAVRVARLDIVGVVTLGMITALGGGILRDVLLGALPPATFSDWRYLVVAAVGGLVAFGLSRQLERLATPITVFDALGLGLFAVTGASRALALGAGAGQAVLLGALTAVGGGTLRDVLVRRVPTVLSSELYAIPALLGAGVVVVADRLGAGALVPSLVGAALCIAVRLVGVRLRLEAPHPPGRPDADPE
ncbi:trimeric intracellular cation channel family protein [Actinomycetospora chlora]|uniref:Trimeric intracellular cation channel family protein n=1 Tax=Actinomycetospora chlora TaxID=663608 RepID=A0ABP9BLZ1_9PSEU